MAGDLPQITSEHAPEIIGDNWPEHSETDSAAACLAMFENAAHSVNNANVADAMFALLESSAKGQTPENLMAGFTADQREAFDEAMTHINMGQGASVAAQDILGTKVQLNGVVETFEAAVQELLAQYSTPGSNQQELQRKYQELLDQAKSKADELGSNHKSTQNELMSGIQKGAEPTVPSTMAATNDLVAPGLPSDSMGALLQQMGGVMQKPPKLPLPDVQKAIQPAAQGMQQGLSSLLSQLNRPGGVDISKDALSKLVSSTADRNTPATLSAPGVGRGLGGGRENGGGGGMRTALSAHSPDNQRSHTPEQTGGDPLGSNEGKSQDTTPTEPPATQHPAAAAPQVTLSAGAAVEAAPSLSAHTHLSSGDVASGASVLGHAAAASTGGAGLVGPMIGPMMGPLMGGAAGAGAATADKKPSKTAIYDPREHGPKDVDEQLRDFGSAVKGLAHTTDQEMLAAAVLAGIVRSNLRAGFNVQAAVGVSAAGSVFATSDGLGFIPENVRLAPSVRPLITAVPDEFIASWLGCDQPWRALLAAADERLVGQFDAVAATDPDAQQYGVLTMNKQQIDAVNIAAGAVSRWECDAVDAADIPAALAALTTAWGTPSKHPEEALRDAVARRWRGDRTSSQAAVAAWAAYLIAEAATADALGKIDDARYLLRVALRVPQLMGVDL